MAEPLQRLNWSMRDVLYEVLDSVHMFLDQLKGCHDPSHGGFYMAEGALYIRIGLPPRIVSGDHLASSRCGLTARYLHCRHAYSMSRDWGCTSTCYRSFYVPVLSMRPWGLYLYAHARPLPW